MADDVLSKVRKVAESFGIPEWIWRPIMDLESGGNPKARAVTQYEDSRGLFQINVLANPQYATSNLYDPEVNARIAFQDFINPAWLKVKQDTNLSESDKAAYVWKEGIRPQWTDEKNQAVRQKAQTYFYTNTSWVSQLSGWVTKLLTGKDPVKGNPVPDKPADPTEQKQQSDDKPLSFSDILLHPDKVAASAWDKLTSSAVTIILLVVGIVLLVMVLKSMFLEGSGNAA